MSTNLINTQGDNQPNLEASVLTLTEGVFVLGPDSAPVQLPLQTSHWSMSSIFKRVARIPESDLVATVLRPTFLVYNGETRVAAADRYRIFSLDAPGCDGEFDHIPAYTTEFDPRRFAVTPTKDLKLGRRYLIGVTSYWKDKAWGPIIAEFGT